MLLLFSLLANAEDEMSSEKYCFSSISQSLVAKQKIGAIQVPSDRLNSDNNCLVIQMRPHRRELIQRFILSSFPEAKIIFSSEYVRREPCQLVVEKMKIKKLNDFNVRLNPSLIIQKDDALNSATEIFQIQTLKDFELIVNQDQIKGTCRFITSNRYEITIAVKKNTISIVDPNKAPPEQDTMVLETQLQLSRGDKIELGGVIKDLKNKSNSSNVKPELTIETGQQNISERTILSLK